MPIESLKFNQILNQSSTDHKSKSEVIFDLCNDNAMLLECIIT